nr:restriction endonuclease subunit S [uncultured Halomonas sp.]
MEIKRERYTPNDVGPSPTEWYAPRLSEVSTLISNGFVGTATPFYTDDSGVPYLYGMNVRANKLDPKGIRYITQEFHDAQAKTALKDGDLLTVQSGHIGTTAVVPPEFEGANCHALIVTRLKKDKANPNFLSYYINSEIGQARLRGLEVGSTIVHINTKDLKKFRVLLPPLPEQKKIAQILSTWDQVITATERLLENSQQRKKGLMQQLLTGKKRLPGFEGAFNSQALSEAAIITMGTSPKSSAYNSKGDGLPLLQGNADIEGRRSRPRVFTSEVTKVCQPGNILLSVRAPVGSVAISDHEACIGRGICAIEAKHGTDQEFLYQWMLWYEPRWANLSQGSTFESVNSSDIKNLLIKLPDISEQKAISKILAVSDRESELLRIRLNRLKQEKKALMQQLLTGKRLVQVDTEAA